MSNGIVSITAVPTESLVVLSMFVVRFNCTDQMRRSTTGYETDRLDKRSQLDGHQTVPESG